MDTGGYGVGGFEIQRLWVPPGKHIGHRLVARPELDNTFWNDALFPSDFP